MFVPVASAQVSPAYVVLGATWLVIGDNFTCSAMAFNNASEGAYLVTARHCAVDGTNQGLKDLEVTQGGGVISPARVISHGSDPDHDWAVLFLAGVQSATAIPLD